MANTVFEDPLQVVDRLRNVNHSLRNMLAGRPTFLVVGGPSAKELPLYKLKQRGIWSMAVNNMAGFFWPNAFVCSDPPSKFHNGIWQDPTIMKFVPLPKLSGRRSHLRQKIGNEFSGLKINNDTVTVNECPNIWGFSRRSWLAPDSTFFTEPEAAWGNHDAGTERTGRPKTVCTMFLAIRLLYYLGSRTIYLVGCDWRMDPLAPLNGNYAFGEARDGSAVTSNNDQYQIAGKWLEEMQNNGTFKKFGLSLYNCYQYSGLRAFPYVPFTHAVADTLKDFPKEPFDLTDWYKK